MRHPRRVRAVLPLVLLVASTAACGSHSQAQSHTHPDAREPATSAAPSPPVDTSRAYSLPQLTAALPTAEEAPGAKRLEVRCRFGKKTDSCSTDPDHTMARVIFSTHSREHASDDHATPHYWRPEELDVEVDEYPDARTAAKGLTTQYDLVKDADGHYSTEATGTHADERWGGRGVGRVQRTRLLTLDGLVASVRQVDVDLEGHHSKPMQIAITAAGWGDYRVVTSAFFYDGEHRRADAERAALGLLEGYLARLGRTT